MYYMCVQICVYISKYINIYQNISISSSTMYTVDMF